jgi:hypothetical protein
MSNAYHPERLSRGACYDTASLASSVQFSSPSPVERFWNLSLDAGDTATKIFLRMLKDPLVGKVPNEDCDLCRDVLVRRGDQARELGKTFQNSMFAKWIISRGTLSVDHARKLKTLCLEVPEAIEELVERNRAELVETRSLRRTTRNMEFTRSIAG